MISHVKTRTESLYLIVCDNCSSRQDVYLLGTPDEESVKMALLTSYGYAIGEDGQIMCNNCVNGYFQQSLFKEIPPPGKHGGNE